MSDAPLGVIVGFVSGFLSGQFGIGGALITTPAVRLLLGRPALVAVGTPLPVVIPSALVGAISYARSGIADVRGGLLVGGFGAVASVFGALAAPKVGGGFVLIVTAALIAWVAVDTLRLAARGEEKGPGGRVEPFAEDVPAEASAGSRDPEAAGTAAPAPAPHPSVASLAVLGLAAGAYSGFLGLGGGVVVVPALSRLFGYPLKRAIGTSLVAISLMAIPGSVTHWVLGDVDLPLALVLAAGVVPGALLGARVTRTARERTVRIGFALMLLAVAVALVLSETGVL